LFGILVLLISLPITETILPKTRRLFMLLSVAMNCLLYGVVIEIIQHYFIPNRSFDLNDIVSDGVGCFLGWYFVYYREQKIPIKKICFYGPESTGKSTMAKHFAELYKTEYVPEVAREMVDSNSFSINDIIAIGKAQMERVKEKSKIANRILFCDTDLITTQIYSQHYLKTVPPVLYELEKRVTYDHYFLFDIDAPWVADGLRDLGSIEDRKKMFQVFKTELENRNINYTLVSGNYNERESLIKKSQDQLF